MFLDEKLLNICKEADIKEGKDVQTLHTKLINECQDYYKARIKPGMPNKEVKVIIDRTFNLWTSFTNMASSSEDKTLALLGKLCTTHTFKNAFMNHPELKKVYDKL